MKAYERLLKYVKIGTPSDEHSSTVPTSVCQFDLARPLAEELRSLGVTGAHVDDNCYVWGILPASEGCESAPKIGFIAHMDTSPDFNGIGVCPQIIENYDGGDVRLGDSGRILSVADFKHLPSLAGRTLITTDGNSLLGADDKAGIAEIMTLIEELVRLNIPHGQISVCFTPDEEVGSGADHFDVNKFGADFAYTVDGGAEGEVVCENFNASSATVEVRGFNIHPGSAKNTMINAQLVAMEFNSMLPIRQTPRDTEGYEGFYHLCGMSGSVESATLYYIVRDHDAESFASRQRILENIAETLNRKYGEGTVTLTQKEQYRNMKEMVLPCYHIVESALEATGECGIVPHTDPIRGGTDGARLSFMGLPCPNLGTGGYAFHGPYEHITSEGMDASVAIMMRIVEKYAN